MSPLDEMKESTLKYLTAATWESGEFKAIPEGDNQVTTLTIELEEPGASVTIKRTIPSKSKTS